MVALLTMLGQIAVQRALRQLEGDAGIVNIAGRQRMLSQRLPRLVLQLQHQDLAAHRLETRQELLRMVSQWETSQEALEFGSTKLSIPGGNSLAIRTLFRENAHHYGAVRDIVRKILASEKSNSQSGLSHSEVRTMLIESDAFLVGMDKIVSQYATEAKQRVGRLQWTERGLLVATLLVLLAEGLLIFSPAVASLSRAFEQLQAVTHQLSNAKEIAESANRAKTAFLTRLSHELRTPLHAVLGMLSELRRTKLNTSQQRRLQLTNQAARTLHSLVNDLLDVAGMEAGAVPKLRDRPVQLSKLIYGAIELMQPIAGKKGLHIQSEISHAFPSWVLVDPDRMRQVIYNLLQNAIRYTDQGSIECRCRVDMSSDPNAVILEISDTGCGIATEDQSRIFESFVSLGESEEQQAFGRSLGLGLPITLAIVKAMDGKLSIASEIGKGTCITVQFPLRLSEPVDRKSNGSRRASQLKQFRGWALVVDDSRTNLILMRSYLTRLGYKTVSATNSTRAIQEYLRKSPDVVVIDKHLGDEDGLALIARLRNSSLGKVPSIYLVTADIYCQATSLDASLGIAAVLHKPLKYIGLKEAFGRENIESESDDGFSKLRSQLQKVLANQLPIDLSSLLEHYQLRDIPQMSLLVHRIRGASANAGLIAIEQRCLILESHLDEPESEACSVAIAGLSEAIAQFSRQISV